MKEDIIQIAIVDDHPAYCEGLKILLETFKDIKVLFIAFDGLEMMEQLKTQRPHLILMDLDMDGMDGEEACELISTKYPEINVIINTSHYNPSFVLRFMKKDIPAIISKTWLTPKIIEAIRSVHHDGHYFDDSVSLMMKKSIAASAKEPVQQDREDLGLNVQELQVLKLMCMWYSTAEIAAKLYRAPKTIDWNRNQIWKKTGITSGNISELIIWSLKKGILAVM